MKRSLIALALVSSFAAVGVANAAGPATSQFNVTINVQAGCEFTTDAVTNLDFGTTAASSIYGTATSKTEDTAAVFHIQCTKGTAPEIALTSDNAWKMKGTNAYNENDTISYELFSDITRNNKWNETNHYLASSSGVKQSIPVYGRVDDVKTVAGSFSDTVTVSFTY